MRDDQAERLIKAVEDLAKATGVAAVMLEEQNVGLSDVQRRLAEIAEAIAQRPPKAAPRGRRKPARTSV